MKVLTVLGTRPEIIRLSRVIEKLDRLCTHVLVHTGQNFDPNLSDVFFQQLRVRPPDYYLGVTGENFGQQIGQILAAVDKVLNGERPEAIAEKIVLLLQNGDLRRRMGQASRERFLMHYTLERWAEKMASVFQDVLEED